MHNYKNSSAASDQARATGEPLRGLRPLERCPADAGCVRCQGTTVWNSWRHRSTPNRRHESCGVAPNKPCIPRRLNPMSADPSRNLAVWAWVLLGYLLCSMVILVVMHSQPESMQCGVIIICTLALITRCMKGGSWKRLYRFAFPVGAWLGISGLSVPLMLALTPALLPLGLLRFADGVGTTIAGLPFIWIALRQSNWHSPTPVPVARTLGRAAAWPERNTRVHAWQSPLGHVRMGAWESAS